MAGDGEIIAAVRGFQYIQSKFAAMRKYLLPLFLTLLLACSQKKTEKSLVGKWKPIELNMPSASEEQKKDLLEKATLEFTKDGKFISRMADQQQTGTFTYNEKTGELNTSSGTNQFEKFKVEWKDNGVLFTNEEEETLLLKKQ